MDELQTYPDSVVHSKVNLVVSLQEGLAPVKSKRTLKVDPIEYSIS